jgi:hypothetical protein
LFLVDTAHAISPLSVQLMKTSSPSFGGSLRNKGRFFASHVLPALLLALSLCCLAVLPRASAATLYGATASGGPGELYILDSTSGGIVQDVGPLHDAFNVNYGITGLAFNPATGLLYGSTANSNPDTRAQLVMINPLSGLVTVIGTFNVGNSGTTPSTMSDIAFDSAGHLYGIGSVGGPQLYSINLLTGQATVIGNSGLTSTGGGGLAISSGGVFYGTPTASRFGTYNPTTGAYVNIANPDKPAGGGAYAALAFNENGVLFGLNSGPGSPPGTHLVKIDPATGLVTDIGASVNALDAIAFTAVPEPTSFALFGLLLTGLATKRWLRK